MNNNKLNLFKSNIVEAKNKWLNSETELSHIVDSLINDYKLISSPNEDLLIDNYYESEISHIERVISEKLNKYFPKCEKDKKLYLGINRILRPDIFIQEKINTNDYVSFIIEVKQSNFFNQKWIYQLREIESILRVKENLFCIIVSNVLPKGIERFGQVNGIIVCKPEEITNAINFAKLFYIEFLYSENQDELDENKNNEFVSSVIKFLESKKIPKNQIADILFSTYLIKILDSILVKTPLLLESRKESNVNPKFYKFLDYEFGSYENTSGLNLKTILNKIKPKKNTNSFSHILTNSNNITESERNSVGLDLIYELIQGYNESLKNLVFESGIFEACKILIEKNSFIEFLSLIEEIKFNDANNLKPHLFSEYHKIHFFRKNLHEKDYDYTTDNKADLLSKFLLNFEFENKNSFKTNEENAITVKLNEKNSTIIVIKSGEEILNESIDKGIFYFIDEVVRKFSINKVQALLLINRYGILDEFEEDLAESFTLKGVNLNKPKEISLIEYSELTCQLLKDIIDDLIIKIPKNIISAFAESNDGEIYEHIILDTRNFTELRGSGGFHIGYEDKRRFTKLKYHYAANEMGFDFSIFDPACGSFNLSSSVSKLLIDQGLKSYTNGYDLKSNSELLNDLFLGLITKNHISFEAKCSITPHIESEEFNLHDNDDKYDLIVCDPPISYNWNHLKENITLDSFNDDSPYYYGIPDINDGEILFLQLMISKMHLNPKTPEELKDLINATGMFDYEIDTQSRIGIFLKNDLLDSNRGNLSQIRSYIIENDLLDSVIKLPKKINDSRSIWILDNNKDQKRKGNINLIDLDKYNPTDRDLLSDEYNSSLIEKINNGKAKDFSKIINNKEFGYYELMVENENNECVIEKIKITSQLSDSKYLEIESRHPNAKVNREKIKIGHYIYFDEYLS